MGFMRCFVEGEEMRVCKAKLRLRECKEEM